MKQIFTIFLAVFAMSFSYAQSFSVSSLSEQKNLDGTNEVAIEVTITNLTSDTINITWERTETRLPTGWANYICDPLHCFGPNTSSQKFTLTPNGMGTFSMHMNPSMVDYAILNINFYPEGAPNEAVTGEYIFGEFAVDLITANTSLDGTNEIFVETTVTNPTSDTITIAWERTETRLPDNWSSYICDPSHCFGTNISSEMFTILPNTSGTFAVHCLPSTTDDYAILDIKFFPKGKPENSVTGTYTFGQVTGTNDLAVAPIALYPNPATNYFQVENGQKVASIEVFNLLGVKVLKSTNTTYVNVSELKSGLYFVRLLNRAEKIITTQRLQKN